MKLRHFAIIMDEFLLVPNICLSSAIFLDNNLTKFVIHFDTLALVHTQNQNSYGFAISNKSHFAIIMDEFLLVSNICPSSAVFLCKNLT